MMNTPAPVNLTDRLLSDRPQPGQRWKNWKGGEYTIVGIFNHTERDEELVAYTDGSKNWARPLDHFLGFVVDAGCWRFEKID